MKKQTWLQPMRKAFKNRQNFESKTYAGRLVSALTSRISENNSSSKKLINVVERSLYNEWTRVYPITEKRAVKKAVKLEENTYDGFILRKQDSGGFAVTFWKFKTQLDSDTFRIMIPESILLSSYLESNEAAVFIRDGKELFIANDNGKIHSAIKTQMLSSVEQFAYGLGIGRIKEDVAVDSSDANAIIKCLPTIMSFVQWKDKKKRSLVGGLTAGSLLFSIYLMGTSFYLHSAGQLVEERYQENASRLQQALALQDKYNQNIARFETLQSLQQELETSFPIWVVTKALYEMDRVAIRRITLVEDNLFEIFGQAERATDVLRVVNQINGVSASFNRPVTSRRDGEIFSLELRLNYDAMRAGESSGTLVKESSRDD